jgi:hypothetical protein
MMIELMERILFSKIALNFDCCEELNIKFNVQLNFEYGLKLAGCLQTNTMLTFP